MNIADFNIEMIELFSENKERRILVHKTVLN